MAGEHSALPQVQPFRVDSQLSQAAKHTMATFDFQKYLQSDTSENEDLWVWFAFIVFFPLVIFWYTGRMLTKGVEAANDQMATNARRQMIRENHQVEQSAQRRLKMQKEHQIYLAEREKRLQAYEEKLRAAPAP
jgi:ABC-type multidrug transport system fused ATPase/permease subunit